MALKVTPQSFCISLLAAIWLFVTYALGTVWGLVCLRHPSTNRHTMGLFSWGIKLITGMKVTITGKENLPPGPAILIANHQGGTDLAVFGHDYPERTVVVAKRELLAVPLFGTYFLATGNLMVNRKRGDQAMLAIRRVAAKMKTRNLRIGFFPEGTRNKSYSGLLPFKKGAFAMAIEAGVPIVPMVASSYAKIGTYENATLRRGGVAAVRILAPVSTAGLTAADVAGLTERVRGQMLAALTELDAVVTQGS